jgi:magnesium transporter
MGVALINGLVWGGIMGGITWWLYDDMAAGRRDDAGDGAEPADGGDDGRDYPDDDDQAGARPAVGSSVMITAITDTGGFFIFLGLATIFLL